jgi:hypothetical protein
LFPSPGLIRPKGATALGQAPVSAQAKPKTPVGRRGASLIHLRTTRARIEPRRPRFDCPKGQGSLKPEAARLAGVLARAEFGSGAVPGPPPPPPGAGPPPPIAMEDQERRSPEVGGT